MGNKAAPKIRQSKTPQIRSPAPKADAANQTPMKSYTNLQPHHIIGNNYGSCRMVVMNTSTGMATQMTPNSPMTPDKLVNQQNKQQQNQPVNVNQQLAEVVMQQQVLKKEEMQLQQTLQQTLQQFQIHQNQQSQQQIQAKPMMTLQAIQGIPQQQIQMGGDRSLIPVQQVQQQLQQQIPCSIQQGIPLQPNLVTQAMNMQQIHPQQLAQMASQGTILTGQIQQQGGTHTVLPQVVNQNGQQMPQLQHITVSAASHQHQPHQTQQLQPQLVPLPPVVPAVTEKDNSASLLQEALSPTQAMPVTTTAAVLKESGSSDGNSVEAKESLPGQDSKQCSTGVDAVASLHIPNAGTVPNQPTTSEMSMPIATTAEEVKERCPPKAMVKPQVSKVLTHVIEDFVIQESSEPFPVSRSGMVGDLKRAHSTNDQDDDISRKKQSMSPNSLSPRGDMAKCEACGVVDLKSKFKKNKRFCSVACSKSGKSKDDKKKSEKVEPMNVDNSKAESTSPSGADDDNTPKVDPLKWGVQEVFEFIRSLPGCSDYAEDFLIQEIDGQALLLLKEDHLMTAMSMKLGPALKIVAKIDDMRIDKEPPKPA
ncbi:polyhomeotic-like protein 2 isoform X1 [Dendroctonus ponderosae]|nr:polyhomeotic-like protein 2 isoform X1 [Dendroctonus ponderosae]